MGVDWQRVDSRILELKARYSGTEYRDSQLSQAMRTIAASVRAGSSLPQALDAASRGVNGDVGKALHEAAARIALGESVPKAIEQMAAKLETGSAHLFARVVAIQHRRGGDLAAPCHSLASLLHERGRLDREAHSATAQARFSSRAVLLIPAVLALGMAWKNPQFMMQLVGSSMILLALPGILLIVVGAVIASRTAGSVGSSAAVTLQAKRLQGSLERQKLRRVYALIAGAPPLSRQSVRLGSCFLLVVAGLLLVTRNLNPALLIAATALIISGVVWPWSDAIKQRRMRETVVDSGIEQLLEVSIAMFAAGATPYDVAVLAPQSTNSPLREELSTAAHSIQLGRSIGAAYDELALSQASPILDAWVHTLCTSHELGSRTTDILKRLLDDARSRRREQLRAAAQTAAPRMQLALVLLVVPGIMWLMLLATGTGLIDQLRDSGAM